ncbi:hypothetical protein PQX77_001712 [Marasmius sp. AFHP31]|nr:hypothetical protein PQX77_001712 [Marasmius sp. AFHP31]
MGSNWFSNARDFNLGGHANFSTVGRDQITYNNDNSRHIKDSYNRNEVNNYGSHNQTYQGSTINKTYGPGHRSRNSADRPPHRRPQVSVPANIGGNHGDEDDDDSSNSEESEDDEAGPMGHIPRDRTPYRYDNAEHHQRSQRRRPQPGMDPASGYPDQRSIHPSQQAYPTQRYQPDPYPSRSRQPPLDEEYFERPAYSGHALNPPYEHEGYYPQNPRYDRSGPYASQRQARSPPPQEDGYHPQSHYSQQPPHGYQNPFPRQQQRFGPPPRDWEVEPNGLYSRAPPSQYPHDPHPSSYRQDDQQSFPRPSPPPPSLATGFDEEYEPNHYSPRQPRMRASRDDPNGQQIPHVEAPTARWASNNPFRNRTMAGVRTAPPSTTVTRSPPSNYPDDPWSEDVEMAPPGVSSGQEGYQGHQGTSGR